MIISEQGPQNKSLVSRPSPKPHLKFWRPVRSLRSIAPKAGSNAYPRQTQPTCAVIVVLYSV